MPPLVVLYIPAFDAKITICELEGLTINRRIIKPPETGHVRPVAAHVDPPLVVFKTPILGVSPASPSPVARYIILELDGSMAKSEHPITPKLSVLVLHVVPPLVELQSPPAGAPTHKLFKLFGSIVIKFTLPVCRVCPPPKLLVMAPLIAVQVVEAILLLPPIT